MLKFDVLDARVFMQWEVAQRLQVAKHLTGFPKCLDIMGFEPTMNRHVMSRFSTQPIDLNRAKGTVADCSACNTMMWATDPCRDPHDHPCRL